MECQNNSRTIQRDSSGWSDMRPFWLRLFSVGCFLGSAQTIARTLKIGMRRGLRFTKEWARQKPKWHYKTVRILYAKLPTFLSLALIAALVGIYNEETPATNQIAPVLSKAESKEYLLLASKRTSTVRASLELAGLQFPR